MDKGLEVPKWRKIPQMPLNLSAQIVCPRPKVWDFDEKRAFVALPKHRLKLVQQNTQQEKELTVLIKLGN